MIAGIAIDISSTHIIHALEHVLSSLNHMFLHGCGLAFIDPYFIKYMRKTIPKASAYVLEKIDP